MSFRRSFTDASPWNTPTVDAPVDPYSDRYIANLRATEARDHVSMGSQAWAMGFSDADHTGTKATITASSGKSVQLHVDPDVPLMSGNDLACVMRCFGCGLEVGLFEAHKIDALHWRCSNYSIFGTSTNGVPMSQVGGQAPNKGHRGVPPTAMFVSASGMFSGVIERRLKISVTSPADRRLDGKAMPIWPLEGWEKGHGTAIPEGAILRLKESAIERVKPTGVSFYLARAASLYGLVVGDTGGKSTLKCQLGVSLPPGASSALDRFVWEDYDVVQLGWGKP